MKKTLFALSLAFACYACGGSATTDSKPVSTNDANGNSQIGGDAAKPAADASKPADAGTAAAAPAKDGKALIEGSDCRTCHKDDSKLIGPAYQDVAKKYAGQADAVAVLSDKVMKGGSGNWGQIPMAAHPNLTADDAKAMVSYILSMKK
jgi:cytochrome c